MTARLAVLVLAPLLQMDQFLEKIDRALDLRPGSIVANIGSGDSTDDPLRISRTIGPTGKILCEDINAAALDRLAAKLKREGVANAEFIVGAADDPKLARASVDAILIARAYHEFTAPRAMLDHLREALKPGGRLVVIESLSQGMGGKPREDQVRRHDIAPEILQAELEAAGFLKPETVVLREAEGTTRYLIQARNP